MQAMTTSPTPVLRDIPVGIEATGTRRETDAMGAIDVPADRYWGAQAERPAWMSESRT